MTPDRRPDEPPEQRPDRLLEHAVAELVAFRRDVIAVLQERFGPRPWIQAPTVAAFRRSAAHRPARSPGGRPEGETVPETVALGALTFPGSYPDSQWREVADAVAQVGQERGFDQLVIHSDTPGDLSFTGQRPDGAAYTFGMKAAAVFTVRTGPGTWAEEPWQELPEGLRWSEV